MKRREGMALLTVLLLIAVMSVMAVGVLDDIRFGVRRSRNAHDVAQAQWYALGAEQLARAQINRLAAADPARTSLAGGWNGRLFVFPIEEGVIRARVRDGGNCFNLNSVVQGSEGSMIRREAGVRQLVALLMLVETPRSEAEALAAALVDWVDPDDMQQPFGAEDEAYARGTPRYRTAGTLLAEPSELRALRGVTPQLYARLRPLVCALPVNDLSPVNINTLLETDALLLSGLTEGQVPPDAARQLIGERPASGWGDAVQMLNSLGAVPVPNETLGQLKVRTRFFALDAEVDYAGTDVVLSALLEQEGLGQSRVAARRWTAED